MEALLLEASCKQGVLLLHLGKIQFSLRGAGAPARGLAVEENWAVIEGSVGKTDSGSVER